MATGLLIILVNRGTKLAAGMLEGEKEYEATVILVTETDSQDITGRIVREANFVEFSREEIEDALNRFRGEIQQVPPMVSALKYRGERLYEIARRGEIVHRPPRRVTISSLTLGEMSGKYLNLHIQCSKGTYIRTLSHDLGENLGCGGCLFALRRTRVGPFDLRDALPLEELLKRLREELGERIIVKT